MRTERIRIAMRSQLIDAHTLDHAIVPKLKELVYGE